MVSVSHHLLTRLNHPVSNGTCDSTGQLKLGILPSGKYESMDYRH
jgi:hypothetical protein